MKDSPTRCCEWCFVPDHDVLTGRDMMVTTTTGDYCGNPSCKCHSTPPEKGSVKEMLDRGMNMIKDNLELSSKMLYQSQPSTWRERFDEEFNPLETRNDGSTYRSELICCGGDFCRGHKEEYRNLKSFIEKECDVTLGTVNVKVKRLNNGISRADWNKNKNPNPHLYPDMKEDKNGHKINAQGNLVYDDRCLICEPLKDCRPVEKSHEVIK